MNYTINPKYADTETTIDTALSNQMFNDVVYLTDPRGNFYVFPKFLGLDRNKPIAVQDGEVVLTERAKRAGWKWTKEHFEASADEEIKSKGYKEYIRWEARNWNSKSLVPFSDDWTPESVLELRKADAISNGVYQPPKREKTKKAKVVTEDK